MRKAIRILRLAALAVLLVGVSACSTSAGESESVQIEDDDLGGVVSSPNGPEAGVWVIAETDDLPTRFARIVVTDDEGRYVIPDLPSAEYDVWVRGYGLVDSPKEQATPGQTLDLTAVVASDEQEAAEYYPAGVFADRRARKKRISGHRARWERHFDRDKNPGRLPAEHKIG